MTKILKMITAVILAAFTAMCSIPAHAIEEDPSVTENLYAEYSIIMDAESGQVISSKNPDETMYPASMTKMMTAIRLDQ